MAVTEPGLCEHCRWMRLVTTRRGSTFYRCGRADTDPRFTRYPPLPVLSCPGYERKTDVDPPARETAEWRPRAERP